MSLRLRLVHSHGDARSGVLSVAAGGAEAGAGVAEALELCGERLNDSQWRAANLCRIAWQGDEKGWQLANDSQTLVCALNGERVTAGKPAVIVPGDTLELGLLRFVVEAGEGEFFRTEPVVSAMHRSVATSLGAGAAVPGSDEEDTFDLSDLALSNAERQLTTKLDDPFGVLDIAGAKAGPVTDPFSELLGEASPRARVMPAAYPLDLLQVIRDEADSAQQGRVSAVTQRVAVRTASGGGERPRANPAAALLDELHDEFVRVLRDPTQLAGRTDWEGFLAPGGERAPTLEELSQRAEPYPLLRDILLPRASIDQVIEDFDPLGESDLLDSPDSEDVLRLFAPELSHGTRVAVPSLTRREHHDLSPDSHMHLGATRADDKASE